MDRRRRGNKTRPSLKRWNGGRLRKPQGHKGTVGANHPSVSGDSRV